MRLMFLPLTMALLVGPIASAQSTGPIDLKQIMADPDWVTRTPERPSWSDDSTKLYFQVKDAGESQRKWWAYHLETSEKPEPLPLKKVFREMPGADGNWNRERSKRVFSFNGDLFIREMASGKTKQLTQTTEQETAPEFLHNSNQIQFRRSGRLLVRNLNTGRESEPFALRFEDDPNKKGKKDSSTDVNSSFLKRKEAELFQYLQETKAMQEESEDYRQKQKQANKKDTEPFFLGSGNEQVSVTLAPDVTWAGVVIGKKGARKQGPQDNMPVWIREEAYVENRAVRSLVGSEEEGTESLVLLDLNSHSQRDIDLKQLPDISINRLSFLSKDVQQAVTASDDTNPSKGPGEKPLKQLDGKEASKPRNVTFRNLEFSTDSRFLLFQAFSTDNKDRWICAVRLKGKQPKLIVIQHDYDEAWIHPYASFNVATWLPNSHTVIFLSEHSGYSHLYSADLDRDKNVKAIPLTSGNFEVTNPVVAIDHQSIFYTANAAHPGIRELYRLQLSTGKSAQLTSLGGMNEFHLSPDQESVAVIHSTTLEPEHLVLQSIDGDSDPFVIADFTTDDFKAIPWTKPEIISIANRNGQPIYSRLYLPSNKRADEESPRAAVIFIHGAGYLQNAHQGWSGYFREFMFHSLLTQRGYVVLDMDYRASAGYGRNWRTAIYRQMGTPELEDIEDGRKWLIEEHGVSPERVGIYGGSYGGFMTLMALFKRPGEFACGAALRPVTDWAHYNHGYTSNILNEPNIDPEAYESSSPIYFAAGLQDPLLICHGMIDDNVFFKDTVRLTQKLIELEKENWQVAMYPVEPHGFRQPSSWLDEYRRILELFERHLQ